jgi:hypothetical protein
MNGVSGAARSFETLEDAIRGGGQGVVTFGIKATGRLSKFGQVVSRGHLAHRLYATFSRTGGLKILDPLGPTCSSFEELAAGFRDLQLMRSPVILVKNPVMVTSLHLAQRAKEPSAAAHQLALHLLPTIRRGDGSPGDYLTRSKRCTLEQSAVQPGAPGYELLHRIYRGHVVWYCKPLPLIRLTIE